MNLGEIPFDRLLEIAALAAYLIVLLWIGLRSARQVCTSEDYTLAGRDVPWIVVMATTAATLVGGGASVGMVSRVYEVGIAAAAVSCAWHLQLIFTGIWIAPKLRGLKLITVADYFGLKFGEAARLLAVINCALFLLGGLVAQMVAMGKITEMFLGVPYFWAVLIGSAVTIFYATAGGMRAVIKTDVMQFLILVGGMGLASVILLVQHGGFSGLLAEAGPQQFDLTGHWSALKLGSLFVAFLLGETFTPSYTTRCFVARNTHHAKWGVAAAGLFLLLFLPIVTFVLGLSAQISLPQIEPQLAFPSLVRHSFPPLVAGVVIGALVAAVMSSADSSLSCQATIVMEDIFARSIAPQATDRQKLKVAQWATLVTGIAAAALALRFSNIIDVLKFLYDFWAPAMVLPFLVGIFWYRPRRNYAVVASMIAGVSAAVVWRFVLESPGELAPGVFGFVVAVFVFFLALPVTSRWQPGKWFQPERPLE